MTVIWCMVPEIWSATDKISCHFGPFLSFYPPNNPKNQNFEKLEKTPQDIIILHMGTINDNHMMYSSWDMECNGQNFLSFWTVFCLFTSLTTQEIKILKKWKKWFGDIIILQMCTINDNHMMYGSWDMKRDGQNFLWYWTVFCHFTPLTTWKIKILKNWKKVWRYYHSTHVYHKWQWNDVWFLRYWVRQIDFFDVLDHFLPFYPPKTRKIKILKKLKKAWRYYHFTQVYQKLWSWYDMWQM